MYVVFQGSYLRRRVQLLRYFLVALGSVILNYVLIKFFVEYLNFYPTPALITTAGFVILFSYLSQRHFSFRQGKALPEKTLSNSNLEG
jgi:putative flippase GtrA